MPAPPQRGETADRHREVLEAALALMAEQGYHGASLRKLAARLGIQQPSLYHYFESKEQLVEQIIETFSSDMFDLARAEVPTRLEDFPRYISDVAFDLYEEGSSHPSFTRVVFAISRVQPRFGALLREIFVDRVESIMRMLLRPYVERGEIAETDGIHLIRMVTNAIGFRLMEEKVLFDERELGPDVHAYAAFVVETARLRIRQLRAERGFSE